LGDVEQLDRPAELALPGEHDEIAVMPEVYWPASQAQSMPLIP